MTADGLNRCYRQRPPQKGDLKQELFRLTGSSLLLRSLRWALRMALSHRIPIVGLIMVNQIQEVLAMAEVVDVMAKRQTVQGLCSTCNHLPACLHRLENGLVVWYCEEFDDYVPHKAKPRNVRQSVAVLPKPSGTDGLMGLCVNCEKRDHCVHAKKVGGVWHCEEYA